MTYFKKIRTGALLLLCICLLLSVSCAKTEEGPADNACADGECEVPETDAEGKQVYAIVSPVGYHDVELLKQAKRLDSLEGKTIALVGGSFMASVTHAELKKCIQETYPTAKILMFQDVGSGGPYSVFGQSEQTQRFQQKLKEKGVDAVISGNCGCGLCTTKESGSAIAAEYIGIPSVTVGAPTFIAQIHSTGVNRGVPVLRTAEYPGAFSSHSTEELKKNAREVVWPQIVKALTTEITEEETALYANEGKRPYNEIVYYGNFEEIQEFCQVNGWTDGLPVIPPTDEKVREYLKYTPYQAEDVLGTYALAYRECLAYTVAANAVMAGVPKEFMPLCIAFTQCMENGEWRRPLASTHGWTPYAWLNGPLARQLGIDHEQGMINEETNKAFGRFIELAMLNLGGYYVKENRMGTFGYLTPWTFSEDEESCAAIGWEPYHVTQGYQLNDNTLTAGSALAWGNNVTPATDDPEMIMTLLAWDITEKQQNGLGNTNPQVYRTVFITEEVAKDLASAYKTKDALENALIATARRPLWMRTFANYWANTGSQQFDKRTFTEHYRMLLADPEERAEMTDTPVWLQGIVADEQLETIATMRKGQTPLLVTGDNVRNKFMVLPGGGYVTVEIKLPENWDELLAPLGYEPLSSFYLDESGKMNENKEERDAKEQETESVAPARGEDISAPAVFTDGSYRLMPSMEQLTDAGRVYLDSDGELNYQTAVSGGIQTMKLSSSGADKRFVKLITTLGYNSSFSVKNGIVDSITVRPSTIARKPSTDLSALKAEDIGTAVLTYAVNVKQSKEGGAVTPGETSVFLSDTVTSFRVELVGKEMLDRASNLDFLTLNGDEVRLNPDAPAGASAKIGVNVEGPDYRTVTVTKEADGTVQLYYRDSDSLNP